MRAGNRKRHIRSKVAISWLYQQLDRIGEEINFLEESVARCGMTSAWAQAKIEFLNAEKENIELRISMIENIVEEADD